MINIDCDVMCDWIDRGLVGVPDVILAIRTMTPSTQRARKTIDGLTRHKNAMVRECALIKQGDYLNGNR